MDGRERPGQGREGHEADHGEVSGAATGATCRMFVNGTAYIIGHPLCSYNDSHAFDLCTIIAT